MKKLKLHTFPKAERLTLRKHIETLFRTGEAFSFSMFRIVYRQVPAEGSSKSRILIGISIPRKKIKKAVQRNLLKRRIREAWRLHKHTLYPLIPEQHQLHLFIIYRNHGIANFADIEQTIAELVQVLPDRLNQDHTGTPPLS